MKTIAISHTFQNTFNFDEGKTFLTDRRNTKFLASLSLPAAALITTLPHFMELADSLLTYGISFGLLCAPALLLCTRKIHSLHNQKQDHPLPEEKSFPATGSSLS